MIPEPVVIIANGNFPSHKEPLLILKEANTIINKAQCFGWFPLVLTGDPAGMAF